MKLKESAMTQRIKGQTEECDKESQETHAILKLCLSIKVFDFQMLITKLSTLVNRNCMALKKCWRLNHV